LVPISKPQYPNYLIPYFIIEVTMLKALRKKETVKKIFFVLAIIIIPAFVFWGAGGALRSRGKEANYAGKIFGRKVLFSEYQESFSAVKNQALMQFGDNLYKVEKYLNLYGQAWDRLILLAEARKRKIKINDDELIKRIRQLPFFQRDDKFNQKLYDTALNYIFRTPARDFEEEMRNSLAIGKLFDMVTRDVKVTEEDLLAAYKDEFEKVKAIYIRFPQEEIENKLTNEEKEKARLAAETALKNIKEALVKKPKSNFKDIIKGLGLELEETPLIGRDDFIPAVGLAKEFIKAAFGLRPQEVGPVIPVGDYFYIVRLEEFVPIDEESFKKDKAGFREKLFETKKEEKFSAYFGALKKSANLEDNIKRPVESSVK